MKPEDLKCRWNEAMTFIHVTVQVLEYILSIGGFFVFEHPAGASSWQLPIILELQKRRGMNDQVPPMSLWASVTYYQATHSKIHPFFVLTNSMKVAQRFDGCFCNCTVAHRVIEGSEGRWRLSKLCEQYPQGLCEALAAALAEEVQQSLT